MGDPANRVLLALPAVLSLAHVSTASHRCWWKKRQQNRTRRMECTGPHDNWTFHILSQYIYIYIFLYIYIYIHIYICIHVVCLKCTKPNFNLDLRGTIMVWVTVHGIYKGGQPDNKGLCISIHLGPTCHFGCDAKSSGTLFITPND